VAGVIGVCGRCVIEKPDENLPAVLEKHSRFRQSHDLPPSPPRDSDGVACGYCVRECVIPEGGIGYCGLRESRQGKMIGGVKTARVSWYHDPLPTNCVADWVCPARTGAGYPELACREGAEVGYANLAVFYESCNFHCLNCQNWHFRERPPGIGRITPQDLADAVDDHTACICYFGGDPGPSLPHSIKASRLARKRAGARPLSICWETNGSMRQSFLKGMLGLALESGGIIKFDLKAYHEPLHKALTGTGNRRTLENFAWLADRFSLRKEYPLLVASTLLVPGYVEEVEVGELARFIASFSKNIPYALLAFHPDCRLKDLPVTSRAQAEACLAAARKAGLRNVRPGNIHLLK
jgi:pyruvate formate lyase activating enzyme